MSDISQTSWEQSPPPAGPYLPSLPGEDRTVYDVAGSHLDLSAEIRLLRTVLAHLAVDITANHRAMAALFGALIRAVQIQATQLRDGGSTEQDLIDAAEEALETV